MLRADVKSVDERRPNIVLVIADDHRADAIRSLGDPNVLTPQLDSLIRGGVCFTQARCQGGMTDAICATSRACLMTGQSVFAAVEGNDLPETDASLLIRDGLPTLAEQLGECGYDTCAVGKWHNGHAAFNRSFARGRRLFFGGMGPQWLMEYWERASREVEPTKPDGPTGGFSTDLIGEAACDYIEDYNNGGPPLFLYVAFTAPHDPRVPPGPFADMYESGGLTLTPDVVWSPPFSVGVEYVRDEMLVGYPRSVAQIRRHLADYYGMISHMDSWIGRIYGTASRVLDDRPLLFVYCSDHGLSVGRHGFMGKQNLYEHSIRIPFVGAGSYVKGVGLNDVLVAHQDICATLLEVGGASPGGDGVDGVGRSLVPYLVSGDRKSLDSSSTAKRRERKEFAYAVYKGSQRMVTDGKLKAIFSRPTGSGYSDEVVSQLFDLENDPWELQDLSGRKSYRNVLGGFEEELERWQRGVDDPLAGMFRCTVRRR